LNTNKVSTAAIAAALPRLHTLTAYGAYFSLDKVAGFFTDLLPRLRVFHFSGRWPKEAVTSAVSPLPLLEDLMWLGSSVDFPLPTAFLGARPIVLRAPYGLIAESLPTGGDAPGDQPSSFLARVCELHLYTTVGISDVAQVLRAAPRLRTFSCTCGLRGETSWLLRSTDPLHPAFVGLIHPRLQIFDVATRVSAVCDDGCASRLRQTCFPRLRELKLIDATFFVTPDATGRHQMPDP
jgi:hypothetical protein